MQGALAQACQASTNGDCVAVCVEGGPVTRVEHLLMDAIVKNVHVRGTDGVSVSAKIEVKRVTFDELRHEISPFFAGMPSQKRKAPSLILKDHLRGVLLMNKVVRATQEGMA